MTDTAALTDTLDLLAQVLDTALDTDLLSEAQYDTVGALVWGVLGAYAGATEGPGAGVVLPTPEALREALDSLSEAC